jgi:hypothetical protein
MATSTLIQNLNSTYVDGFGASVGSGTATSHRGQLETFIASSTVVVGDAVALDLSKSLDGDKMLYVLKADTDVATATTVVGIVTGSAQTDGALTAGSKVTVCVSGLVLANVDGATVAGSTLCVGATAGQLAVYTNASVQPIVAIAAEADTANYAKVVFIKQF